jgi:hypothetical protein
MNNEDTSIPGERLLPFQVYKNGERVGAGFNTLDEAVEYVRALKRGDVRFEIYEKRKLVWPPQK